MIRKVVAYNSGLRSCHDASDPGDAGAGAHVASDGGKAEGWGIKLVHRRSADLVRAFPSARGLLPRNLQTMRAFAADRVEREVVQQLVARIPWGQKVESLDRLADDAPRRWHAERV